MLAMTRQRTDELKAYRQGSPLSHESISVQASPDTIPEGPEGLRYLVNRGKLRPASEKDIRQWVEKARANRADAGEDWNPKMRTRMVDHYVVLEKTRFPKGLAGAHSAGFIIPEGVPVPSGDPGHSRLYFMSNGACQGPMCP